MLVLDPGMVLRYALHFQLWCGVSHHHSQLRNRRLASSLATSPLYHHFHFHFHFRLDFLRGRRSRQPVGPPSASSPPRPLASYSSLLGLSHDVPPLPLVAVALCANHRPTKPTAVRRLKPGLCSKGLQGAEGWALGRAGQTGQGRDGKLSHAPSWIHAPGQRAETTRTTKDDQVEGSLPSHAN